MKKIVVLVSILFTGIASLAYVYFAKLGTDNEAKDLALQSATNHAAMVFSFINDKSFYDIIESQDLLQKVLGEEKTALLGQLKTAIILDPSIHPLIQEQPVYLSLLPDSSQHLNYLITVQLRSDVPLNSFREWLRNRKKAVEVSKDLYSVQLNDSLQVFVGMQQAVATLSTELTLVRNAGIKQADHPFTAYIKESNRASKNSLLSLYVNFNQAPKLLKSMLSGDLNGETEIFNRQNSFATLHYNFSRERILFNGTTEIKADQNYLQLFAHTAPQKTSIQNILPEQTANYTLYAFDTYSKWHQKLVDWQIQNGTKAKADAVIAKVRANYSTDLNQVFLHYTRNQFMLFQLSSGEKLAAIELNNGEKVRQLLLDVSNDDQDEIRSFKWPDICYAFFGEPFKKFSKPYYTIIDNHLVMANYASTLEVFLGHYRNNRLLMQDQAYLDAMNQVPLAANIVFYLNNRQSTGIFRRNLRPAYVKALQADSGLKYFDTFCYQMVADQSKFMTNVVLNRYVPKNIQDSLIKLQQP